ncbi:hypothetical protein [uncultured Subdoligranulum sp.]|uniref:hypothetical protein n=1 Tax=uncultured Subdoligranulum sp. TaxID=512298 RepID=UPI0025D9995B|nr:hypothetical protein [uncultured Subdoligranulum sp.]
MQSYPFTSQVTYDEHGLPLYDRAVDSEFLRAVFAAYFSDGIFYKPTNALQVVAGTGLQVQVTPGICHIRGAMGIETETRTLTAEAAGTLPRIDTVVARLDLSLAVRSIELYILKGTPSSSPQRPALTRDATIWELGLADIAVAANASTITQSSITDTRLDTSRCGVVAQTIGSLDTAPYFSQLTAAIASHQEEAEEQIRALQEAIAAVEGNTAWMLRSLYDPQNKRQDIFAYPAHLYKATFLVDGWTGDGPYTQTVSVQAVDGGPAITSASHMTSGLFCDDTVQGDAQDALLEAAALVDKGKKTFGSGTITCVLEDEKPEADAEVYFNAKKGGA